MSDPAVNTPPHRDLDASGIRICPERDGPCPHGMACPYNQDRYKCSIEASRAAIRALASTPNTGEGR